MQKIFNRVINSVLFFLIIFIGTGIFPGLPIASAKTPDNWQLAVLGTQQLLQKNPDFQTHLTGYQQQSASIISSLSKLKDFQDFLTTTINLQTTTIPRIGNGWDELIKAMNSFKPASGDSLAQFVSLTEELITLSSTPLPGIQNPDLSGVISAFTAKPSKETLLALDASGQELNPSLIFLNTKNDELAEQCDQLSQTITILISGLDFTGYVAQSPQIIEYVNLAKSQLPLVSTVLNTVKDQKNALRSNLSVDIQLLENIHAKVLDAQHLDSLNSPQAEKVKASLWPFIVLGAFLVVGIFVLVFILVSRSQKLPKKGRTPPPSLKTGQGISSLSSESGFKYDLNGEKIKLGRGEECELRIADPAISRVHATLRYAEGAWYIQDISSTTGVFVNGQRVQASRLNHGDKLGIGRTILNFKEAGK